MLTFQEVKKNEAIRTYIQRADESLTALGYTEHSFAHVTQVAEHAGYILETLGYPERTVELAKIAGFLHDIGNLVNRVDHSKSGAVMAFRILDILADKCDVRRSRVRNQNVSMFDIHDRVNYSVRQAELAIDREEAQILLSLTVDTEYGSVMDYFEIFMGRMLLCRKAAEKLGLQFKLKINGQSLI